MEFLRRCVEKLSRGKRFKRYIYVSAARIPIFVSPDAQLKYLKSGASSFDQDLISIAEAFIGDESVVWDIGANVGVFTYAAASLAKRGSVVAVEADIWLADLLGRTKRLSDYRNIDIRILPVAISNNDGVAVLQIASRGRASNALEEVEGRSQMGGVREKQYVPCLMLDTLLESLPAPEFIKIDVEGAEVMVLQGAGRMLSEIRPVIYMEVGPTTRDSVLSAMKKLDYMAFSPSGDRLHEINIGNVFFVPNVKESDFQDKRSCLDQD
jgi:FkbM family methyltransferase